MPTGNRARQRRSDGKNRKEHKKHSERQRKVLGTPEVRKKMSEGGKKRFETPEARTEHRKRQKEIMGAPEVRAKICEGVKKRYENPEAHEKLSEAQKRYFENPENRERTRLATIKYNIDHSWFGDVKYYDGPQYCEKWTAELRERVRAWFGYVCVECGTPQGQKKLSVHHVHYNKKLCCDDTPRTLVPLCASCHTKTTQGDREAWSEHFQEIIDAYYEGRCWFTREEMKQYRSSLKD